jgi:NADH dehydrogenase
MILVVGATGDLGGRVSRLLLDRGEAVRILVRHNSSYDDLLAGGAQPVVGDLKDPPSLEAACAGVDSVLTTANSTARGGDDTIESVDVAGNTNLIGAAAAAGVRHFVFVSALGAHPSSPSEFLRAKGESEQRLRDSGMAWTVLQPNGFMDKLIPPVVGGPALAGQPVTLVGEGARHHSFVAMQDVAAYGVAALQDKRAAAEGETLVIGGPEPLSWRDIVCAFEQELGRALPVETVPPFNAVPGLPDFLAQLLSAFETYDSPIDMTELSSTYGVKPTDVRDFVRTFLAASREQVA